MKTLFSLLSTEEGRVGTLAGTNIGLNGLAAWMDFLEPMLRVGLLLAQILVAVITAIYITRKAIRVKPREEDNDDVE
jgi:hypothetical protein